MSDVVRAGPVDGGSVSEWQQVGDRKQKLTPGGGWQGGRQP